MKDLSREEAIALLVRISYNLQYAEDSNDFCLWLAKVFEEYVNLKINLKPQVK